MIKSTGKIFVSFLCLLLFSACGSIQTANETVNSQSQPGTEATETAAVSTKAETSAGNTTAETTVKTGAAAFADINAKVGAGIIFDGKGSMFVARDGELDKITPDGKVSTFCSYRDLPHGKDYYFLSPLIWDMTLDAGGSILAAAQDRILKISPDGSFTTLIEEEFGGFLGASGIERDGKGNIYITNGGKIEKYSAGMKKAKSPFIDGSKGETAYDSFFSLEFDPEYKNLYVSDFNTKTLLKYPVGPDGKASENPAVIVRDPIEGSGSFGSPLNITFSKKGDMYVSVDGMAQVLKIDAEGKNSFLKLGDRLSNHIIAFGGKGFDEGCLYFTTYDGKSVYKYELTE